MPDIWRFIPNVADGIPIAIWVGTAPDGVPVYTNEAFRKLIGEPRVEQVCADNHAVGYGFHCVDGSPYPESRTPFVRVLAAREPLEIEDIVVHRTDDRKIPIRAWGKPIGEPGQAPSHVAMVLLDMSSQRHAEARIRAIDDASPVAIGVVSVRTNQIVHANAAMCALFESDLEEVVGQQAHDFYDDPAERDEVLRDVRERGEVSGRKVRIRTPSGKRLLAETHVRLLDVEGEPCFLGTILDVTQAHQREQLLRHSLAEKEVLLREIHHRVKNNMQIVSSMLSLQATVTRDPGARSSLEDSRARIAAMAAVHEVLYGSASLSEFRLDAFIERLASQIVRVAGASAPELQLELAPLSVEMDAAVPCGLILNEVLTNAVKHAFPEGGGTIRVSLRRTSAGRHLRIEDDGVGFDPLIYDRPETLGMRLLTALASQVGGTLEVRSEPGRGALFWLRF